MSVWREYRRPRVVQCRPAGVGVPYRSLGLAAGLAVLLGAGCSVTTVQSSSRAPVDDRSRPAASRPTPPQPPSSARVGPPVVSSDRVYPPDPLEVRPLPGEAHPPSGSAAAPEAVSPARPGAAADAVSPPVRVAAANPAAAALLGQANEQTRAGELDQASSSLERALRIEPNNPWIWHQLAQVRLSQRQDEQAVQMAGRSNTLTSDRGLQARNWRVIAQARARLGQEEAARSAAAKARDLGGP